MAEDINRVILVGRLTRDGELSYTTSGYAILKFSLAVNRRRKQGEQWIEEGNFFDVSLFGRRGESIANYMTKGKQVAVEGQLRQDRWEAQDGTKRSKVYIDATNIQFLGGRDGGGQGGGYGGGQESWNSAPAAPSGGQQRPPQAAPAQSGPPPAFEDDIPF